jgi:hypothetical protein
MVMVIGRRGSINNSKVESSSPVTDLIYDWEKYDDEYLKIR